MTSLAIHPGLSMADYHALDAASNSRLSWLKKSPAHCRSYMDAPQEDTPALALGRAVHTAILEPAEFHTRYVQAEQCNATTQKGTRCSKGGTAPLLGGGFVCATHLNVALAGTNPRSMTEEESLQLDSREVLSADDWRRCQDMATSVHKMERASRLLESLTHTELTVTWTDEGSGVLCKSRLDGYSPAAGGTVVDLKTTVDASRDEFQRSIWRYGYHRQGALYIEAANAAGLPCKHYAIIAQEKTKPYAVGLYRLTSDTIAAGSDQVRPLLARYAECVKSGEWPGLNDGEVVDIGLPAFAWKELEG